MTYDQLFFRPMVTWADKFRVEQTAAAGRPAKSRLLELFRRTRLVRKTSEQPIADCPHRRAGPLAPPRPPRQAAGRPPRIVDLVWYGLLVGRGGYLRRSTLVAIPWNRTVVGRSPRLASNGALTLLRVVILIAVASIIWVPIGCAVGLRPKLRRRVQPVAQFLAAFPANYSSR